jgi:hypothetical protein
MLALARDVRAAVAMGGRGGEGEGEAHVPHVLKERNQQRQREEEWLSS